MVRVNTTIRLAAPAACKFQPFVSLPAPVSASFDPCLIRHITGSVFTAPTAISLSLFIPLQPQLKAQVVSCYK
uniref:Uncharacterized protein n=1 Tax=Arundo donax TaxID=35708 RepID=A0A0A9BS32_ARUDO